jgi:hypothetical protein
MKSANRTIPVIAFVIIVPLFLLFSGRAMTGARLNGGMMGVGRMGGVSWTWVPAVVFPGSGIFPDWTIFGKK